MLYLHSQYDMIFWKIYTYVFANVLYILGTRSYFRYIEVQTISRMLMTFDFLRSVTEPTIACLFLHTIFFCESLYHGDVSSECIPEGNILYTSMISVTTKVMNVILDYQYFFYFE